VGAIGGHARLSAAMEVAKRKTGRNAARLLLHRN